MWMLKLLHLFEISILVTIGILPKVDITEIVKEGKIAVQIVIYSCTKLFFCDMIMIMTIRMVVIR